MSRPWKLHRWVSPASLDECQASLVEAAGVTWVRERRANLRVTVSITGRTLVLRGSRPPHLLPGAPYLHAMLVRRPEGTLVVGRFNPGAVVLATVMLAVLIAAIVLASAGTDSGAFWQTASQSLRRPPGIVAAAIVAGMAVVTTARVFTWRRDSADIGALLKQCCAAETDVPSDS